VVCIQQSLINDLPWSSPVRAPLTFRRMNTTMVKQHHEILYLIKRLSNRLDSIESRLSSTERHKRWKKRMKSQPATELDHKTIPVLCEEHDDTETDGCWSADACEYEVDDNDTNDQKNIIGHRSSSSGRSSSRRGGGGGGGGGGTSDAMSTAL